jgi:hypothetical protein
MARVLLTEEGAAPVPESAEAPTTGEARHRSPRARGDPTTEEGAAPIRARGALGSSATAWTFRLAEGDVISAEQAVSVPEWAH